MFSRGRCALLLAILLLVGPLACGYFDDDDRKKAEPVEFTVTTADRRAGLDGDAPIEINFTRALDTATVTYDPATGLGSFSVTNTRTGEKITGDLEVDGDTLVFRPDGGLGDGVVYRVELSEEIADLDGTALGEELALLISTQALDRVDVEVMHPYPGRLPKLLLDVCYDVGENESYDLEWLRWAIENAADLAVNRSIEWVEPRPELYSEPLFTKFHFWPNLINLTEVYYGDADLYTLIIEEFLAFEPDAAALLPALLDAIVAGERVFLARDFVTFVQDAFNNYSEVHYGFLVNLDAEWIREVLVHEFADLGLPLLHDPHTTELQEIFDDPALVRRGNVWEICLRANFDPRIYRSIIVDRLDGDAEFYLRRVHQTCSPAPDDPPPPPLEVAIPPPGPNPPPPGGNGGGNGGNGGGNGGGGDDGGPAPPKNPEDPGEPEEPEGEEAPFPWPWPGPEAEEPGEPEQGSDAPNPGNCNREEIDEILEELTALQGDIPQKMEARTQDVETFAKCKWVWDGTASYNDPCLQALYLEYKAQIDALLAQKGDLDGQAEAEEKAQSKKDLDPVLNTARIREDIWDNMLTTGGPWSNVRVACMPPWIPAGGNPFTGQIGETVIIITVEQQARFQKDVYKGLVRGLSFDAAIRAAIDNGHNYPPEVVDGDKIYQLIWKTYAECMKKLYEEMAKIYLPLVYPNATEEQLAEAWKVMCEGKSALTESQDAALADWQADYLAACVEEGNLIQQSEDVQKQIDDLRREFRARALEECFKVSLKDIEKCRTKQWILDDFIKFVTNPDDGDGTFIKGDYFCEVIDEMLSMNPPPCLKAYLEGLKSANCQGEVVGGGD